MLNKKTIKILLSIVLCMAVLTNFAVSLETVHLDECHDDNCIQCSLIHNAIKLINSICKLIIFHIIQYSFCILQIALFIIYYYKKHTIVTDNVRLNE